MKISSLDLAYFRVGSHGSQDIYCIPSHLRSICAILAIESMELGPSYHFTQGPMHALSPKYDTYAHVATLFGGEAHDLCWELGWAKSYTQLSTQVAWNNQNPTIMIINHILMVSWGSKVETMLPCSDLLTWVGLGASCEPALIFKPSLLYVRYINFRCWVQSNVTTKIKVKWDWKCHHNLFCGPSEEQVGNCASIILFMSFPTYIQHWIWESFGISWSASCDLWWGNGPFPPLLWSHLINTCPILTRWSPSPYIISKPSLY